MTVKDERWIEHTIDMAEEARVQRAAERQARHQQLKNKEEPA